MSLSKSDEQKILGMMLEVLKGNLPEADIKKMGEVKVSTEPKDLVPFSERDAIIDKLTSKERQHIWGEIDESNLFKNKYKAGKTLFEVKGIDGKPSLPYAIAWSGFIVPICKSRKKTAKQMKAIKSKAIKQLNTKADAQSNAKAKQWIAKAIQGIQEAP